MKTPPIICCLFAVVLVSCAKKQSGMDKAIEESMIRHSETQKALDALDTALDGIPECAEDMPESDCEEGDTVPE